MNLPLQISFHGMEPSQALEAAAAKKAHKLDELSADTMSCRVVIEQQQKHQHPVPRHGDVVRLDTEGRFGFIRTPDGDEYYFDRENLAGANFDQVQIGAEVQFLPEVGAEGRQAKRVSFGKHRFDGTAPVTIHARHADLQDTSRTCGLCRTRRPAAYSFTRWRPFNAKVLLGSVTTKVLAGSKVAVLLLH